MSGTLKLYDRWLRVQLDGKAADFHYLWLRHNSGNERHPLTGESLLDSSELEPEIHPLRTELNEERLFIAWSDGTESRYPLGWLAEHAYALDRVEVPPPPSDLGRIELIAHESGSLGKLVEAALERVQSRGAALVRGLGKLSGRAPVDDTEPIIQAFENTGLKIIETHFGRIEDLRPDNTTNKNTDQLGYTNVGIELHTDQPFLEHPPRYQLLQAIEPATTGGESFIVDAEAAARYLASLDPDAYELLTTVDVRFHRKQKAFERLVVAPILNPQSPRGFLARFSYFTLAPHRIPFELMGPYYAAYNRFTQLVRNPSHQYRFKLAPGDWVIYDNLRMLHARTAFEGPRWVRGIYLDA